MRSVTNRLNSKSIKSEEFLFKCLYDAKQGMNEIKEKKKKMNNKEIKVKYIKSQYLYNILYCLYLNRDIKLYCKRIKLFYECFFMKDEKMVRKKLKIKT